MTLPQPALELSARRAFGSLVLEEPMTTRDLEQLTALFGALGARDPEQWAASQLREGIPQLHRYLFLRQAWKSIVPVEDSAWMAGFIEAARRDPNAPYAGVGLALHRMKESGVADRDITELVRGMQAELLFQFCYLLADPGVDEDAAQDVAWGLFSVDEDGAPKEAIGGLHESVLEMDPMGREMRPMPRG
jgi:hypothetical protein